MKTKEETTEYLLKYGELFGKMEKRAKEYADDMKKLEALNVEYGKIRSEIQDIKNKWNSQGVDESMDDFVLGLIKENGYEYNEDNSMLPDPFK